MWNGTIFVDLDWPLNASSLLSASAELLVSFHIDSEFSTAQCRSTVDTVLHDNFVPIQLCANLTKLIRNKIKQKLYWNNRETHGHNILWGYNILHTLQKVIMHKPKSAESVPDPSRASSLRSHGDVLYTCQIRILAQPHFLWANGQSTEVTGN